MSVSPTFFSSQSRLTYRPHDADDDLRSFDVSRGFKLREIAFAQAKSLSGIIDLRLRTARNIPVSLLFLHRRRRLLILSVQLRIDSLAHRLQGMFIGSDSSLIVAGEQASGFYRRLIEAADIVAKAEKRNVVLDELNASVQATVIGAAPTQGQGTSTPQPFCSTTS